MNDKINTTISRIDVQQAIIDVLTNNAWIIVVICIAVVLALYAIIGLITCILKWVSKRFENCEYIELGKLKIKNRHYKQQENDTLLNGTDIKRFLTLIDLVISNEMGAIVQKVVEALTLINAIENTYKDQCNMIFKTSFIKIKNEYHERLISYACKASNFSIDKIHKTREYFFISEMLHNLEILWTEKSNDIIKRNGFIEILEDRSKAKCYIDELNDCISQALDIKRIEVTSLIKSDLDSIIDSLKKDTRDIFDDMFLKLGEIKKGMIEKRSKKMNQIDSNVKHCVEDIMANITTTLLCKSPNANEIEITNNDLIKK